MWSNKPINAVFVAALFIQLFTKANKIYCKATLLGYITVCCI